MNDGSSWSVYINRLWYNWGWFDPHTTKDNNDGSKFDILVMIYTRNWGCHSIVVGSISVLGNKVFTSFSNISTK